MISAHARRSSLATLLTYPHTDFEHMIAFFPDAVGKAKAVEDLETSTLQSIRLSVEDFGATFVYDAGFDA